MASRTSEATVAEEQAALLPHDQHSDHVEPHHYDVASSKLFLSHFLSTWNARLFEFAAVLYLSGLYPDTLLPMSIYATARSLAVIFFASCTGAYIDSNDRLRVMQFSIVWQRAAVAASCTIFLLLSTYAHSTTVQIIALFVLSILAGVEKVCATVNMVASEKDWVVVIAATSSARLADMSAQMRTIDLLCKLIAPLCIAYLAALDLRTSIVITLAMNVVSVLVEMRTTKSVYDACPALGTQREFQGAERRSHMVDVVQYFKHRAVLPSFSGALLYCTVLSFGGQMVAYLLATGFTATHIAAARTASVAFELSAMSLAPRLIGKIGPTRAGLWSLNFQSATLAVGAAVFVNQAASDQARTAVLVLGTIFSRIGLWGSELSVQLIVQENVAEGERGSFSSIEAAWQNVFELASFSLTIIFNRPAQFRWPVLISLASVLSSLCMYTGYVRMHRGHLFHLSCHRSR